MNTKQIKKIIRLIAPIIWACLLRETDSYYSTYLIISFSTVLATLLIKQPIYSRPINGRSAQIFGVLFSLAIVLANFKGLISATILFLSGWIVGITLYNLLDIGVDIIRKKCLTQQPVKVTAKRVALITFFSLMVIDMLYLVLIAYPGNLSPDSFSQINQIVTGSYTNHHPYWHTVLIKAAMSLVSLFTMDINLQIAGYCFFQIVALSLVLSFSISTVYQITKSIVITVIVASFYALMPYNIANSCTVWKDIPFSMCILLLSTCLLRNAVNIGSKGDLVLLILALVGTGLLRNNGTIVLVLTIIWTLVCVKKMGKVLLICEVIVLSLCMVLKGPVLTSLNVKPGSFAESLSVPIQQISRVIQDEKELSEEQKTALEKIVDFQKVKEEYLPYISDPMKSMVANSDGFSYLVNNKLEYLKIWLEIGLKYPKEYLDAWIQQTKGYWNNGYPYWYISTGVYNGSIPVNGIKKTDKFPLLSKLFIYYVRLFDFPPLNIFRSIGVQVWLALFIVLKLISEHKNTLLVTILPSLAVWMTLLIATPVFSEFRYIYCLFLVLPLFASCLFVQTSHSRRLTLRKEKNQLTPEDVKGDN